MRRAKAAAGFQLQGKGKGKGGGANSPPDGGEGSNPKRKSLWEGGENTQEHKT